MQDVERRVRRLGLFARAMRNKLEAINESARTGGVKVKYQALGPDGWLPDDGEQKTYYNANSEKSVRFANQVNAETAAVITLANEFAKAYPSAKVREIPIPTLNLGVRLK
jgi:hypothetical protein